MRTADQVRWDFVEEWLRKANSDIEAAQVLVAAESADYDAAAFHAQQAAEKMIKAYLVRHQVEFAKTHEIRALRDAVAATDPRLAQELADADELTPYAVDYRYPGEASGVSQEDARAALRVATDVRGSVLAALRDYLSPGRPPDEAEPGDEGHP